MVYPVTERVGRCCKASFRNTYAEIRICKCKTRGMIEARYDVLDMMYKMDFSEGS